MKPSGDYFEVVVFDSNGVPADYAPQNLIMVLDMDFMPAFEHRPLIVNIGHANVRLPAADSPFAICMPHKVDGFGHVYLYADNEGQGYQSSEVKNTRLNLSVEFAKSRLAAVKRKEKEYKMEGADFSAEYMHRIVRAEEYLNESKKNGDDTTKEAKYAMSSLCESMHAGEMLVLEHARAKIKTIRRDRFYFGCNGESYPGKGEKYAELFSSLYNYVTVPFFRSQTEKIEGQRDFSKDDQIVEWASRSGMLTKGHPLIWLHEMGTPDWLRSKDKDYVMNSHLDYVADAVSRFKGRIDYWDIINEAHSWNNIHRWEYEDLIDITKKAAIAVHENNPDSYRVVNLCFTWSEYVATGWGWNNVLDGSGRSTIKYMRDVIDAGTEFEAIGIQMYDPSRDMFEISRHIDMFAKIGKTIHITELGVSSKPDPIYRGKHIYVPNQMYWHGRPASQKEQADWIEAFYTLCYSKPQVEAITWWGFSEPAFLPHGGMVDENLQPKESYIRLKNLITSWK